MTQSVKLLSDHVANKIAAGEVVDRPVSVVKELVENAIDAGATRIDIELVSGGKKSIAVIDNGRGMNRDDALLAVERHATSKIRDVDDIEHIATRGFRGEALAAIASVSRFLLRTRPADQLAGTEVEINGGTIQDVRETGCPPGTEFRVRNLFYNVPARRKFLKGDQTELALIRQLIRLYALAWPAVALRLVSDDRELLNLPGGSTLADRLAALHSPEFVRALRPVDYAAMGMCVTGLAGVPQLARKDRREQYIFVNQRPASAPLIGYAVNESYSSLIPKGRHPVVFLFIELDPGALDVNVHPQKKEVRFRQGREVRDLVITGLVRALHRGAENPAANASAPQPAPQPGTNPTTNPNTNPTTNPAGAPASSPIPVPYPPPNAAPGAAAELQPPTQFELPGATNRATDSTTGGAIDPQSAHRHPGPSEPIGPWVKCRVVGRVGGLFVLLETEDGLVIMDPQAAHERVLYEQYLRNVRSASVTAQGLLTPETVELPPADAKRLRDNLPLLQRMGFGVDAFGGDAFLVDALPAFLQHLSPASLLADLAASLETGAAQRGTEHLAEEELARTACRASVKNALLSEPEIDQLVADLAHADMPYTSPRGRPTLIFNSFNELKRKFGRV